MKYNTNTKFLGDVAKTSCGAVVGSMAEIKEKVYAKDAHKFTPSYAKRTQKDMSDDEIEAKAYASINSDSDFLNELCYGKRGNR